MKKVLTYGTFDLFHHGHLSIIQRAKEQGDYLVVGISSDEFNKTKNKISVQNLDERIKNLKSIKEIDEIIVEESWDQKEKDIRKYGIDLLVMGDDWKGKFNDLGVETLYLPRTQGVSTTEIKKILSHKLK